MGLHADAYKVEFIDTRQALHGACTEVTDHQWVAVDTEFMRESSYYPQLCCVQLAVPGRAILIDVLAIDDLAELFSFLGDSPACKVIHSARQDIEAIHRRGGVKPGPLFDTQLAAGFLGFNEQIGYADLVEQRLGVRLPKGHTRTDWSRRPLSPAQREYALHDVIYLAELYPGLREELRDRSRLSWLLEEQKRVDEALELHVEPEDAWLRIGSLRRMQGRDLAVGRSLAAWREREAQCEDRPRRWLMSDKVLVHFARAQPTSVAQLSTANDWPRRLRKRYGEQVIEAIGAGLAACAEPSGSEPITAPALDAPQRSLFKALTESVNTAAVELDIVPSLLARSDDLKSFVRGATDVPFLRGWRRDIIGERLLELRGAIAGAAS